MEKRAIISHKFIALLLLLVVAVWPLSAEFFALKSSQAAQLELPEPTSLLDLSKKYSYPQLKGIKVDPNQPFKLEFIIDTEDQGELAEKEVRRLVEYFLAALTVPDDDLWVNLSPYERQRIIPENLSHTELGKDLLAQDYILKQLSSSLTYPESDLGAQLWHQVYQGMQKEAHTFNLPVDAFNKIWITPSDAKIYENENFAVIAKSRLKVMHEDDYLALRSVNKLEKETGFYSQALKEFIIPALETEVNEGKHFAKLRQIYSSFILATWFKRKLSNSIFKYYIGENKVEGIELDDKAIKEKIYNLYVEAFERGAYSYIVKENDLSSERKIKRQYSAGGINLKGRALQFAETPLSKIAELIDKQGLVSSSINLKPQGQDDGAELKAARINIITNDHKNEQDIELQEKLITQAMDGEIVLGIENVARNDVAENKYIKRVYKRENKGLVYGFEDDFYSAFRGLLITYGLIANLPSEEQIQGILMYMYYDELGVNLVAQMQDIDLGKIELAIKLRESAEMLKYWQKIRELLSDEAQQLYDKVLDYSDMIFAAIENGEEYSTMRLQGLLKDNSLWLELLKVLLTQMLEDKKEIFQSYDYEKAKAFLDSAVDENWQMNIKPIVVDCADNFIAANMKSIIENAPLDKEVYFVIGGLHGKAISSVYNFEYDERNEQNSKRNISYYNDAEEFELGRLRERVSYAKHKDEIKETKRKNPAPTDDYGYFSAPMKDPGVIDKDFDSSSDKDSDLYQEYLRLWSDQYKNKNNVYSLAYELTYRDVKYDNLRDYMFVDEMPEGINSTRIYHGNGEFTVIVRSEIKLASESHPGLLRQAIFHELGHDIEERAILGIEYIRKDLIVPELVGRKAHVLVGLEEAKEFGSITEDNLFLTPIDRWYFSKLKEMPEGPEKIKLLKGFRDEFKSGIRKQRHHRFVSEEYPERINILENYAKRREASFNHELESVGGIILSNDILELDIDETISFNVSAETIRKFQTSSGLAIEAVSIEESFELKEFLELKAS